MRKTKGNPKWVREGWGNKTNGALHWEYRINGKYYAHGFYHTPEEAHQECIKHQEMIAQKNSNNDIILM